MRVDVKTGEVFRHSWCKANWCLFCARVRARQYHRAVRLAAPSQMIGLSGLTGTWQEDRLRMKQVLRRLRHSYGLNLALAWAVEPNPEDTGYHAHGWVWGSHLTKTRLADSARRAGLGRVTVEAVRFKGNFAYPMKNATHNESSLAAHRRLNGAELLHARHFWRDGRTGETLTRDEAVRRSSSAPPPDSAHCGVVPLASVGEAC